MRNDVNPRARIQTNFNFYELRALWPKKSGFGQQDGPNACIYTCTSRFGIIGRVCTLIELGLLQLTPTCWIKVELYCTCSFKCWIQWEVNLAKSCRCIQSSASPHVLSEYLEGTVRNCSVFLARQFWRPRHGLFSNDCLAWFSQHTQPIGILLHSIILATLILLRTETPD